MGGQQSTSTFAGSSQVSWCSQTESHFQALSPPPPPQEAHALALWWGSPVGMVVRSSLFVCLWDGTGALCSESTNSWLLDPQGMPSAAALLLWTPCLVQLLSLILSLVNMLIFCPSRNLKNKSPEMSPCIWYVRLFLLISGLKFPFLRNYLPS